MCFDVSFDMDVMSTELLRTGGYRHVCFDVHVNMDSMMRVLLHHCMIFPPHSSGK